MKKKRYLIVNYFFNETHFTNNISKKELADLKDGVSDAIIDLENETYFDAKENKWKEIKLK